MSITNNHNQQPHNCAEASNGEDNLGVQAPGDGCLRSRRRRNVYRPSIRRAADRRHLGQHDRRESRHRRHRRHWRATSQQSGFRRAATPEAWAALEVTPMAAESSSPAAARTRSPTTPSRITPRGRSRGRAAAPTPPRASAVSASGGGIFLGAVTSLFQDTVVGKHSPAAPASDLGQCLGRRRRGRLGRQRRGGIIRPLVHPDREPGHRRHAHHWRHPGSSGGGGIDNSGLFLATSDGGLVADTIVAGNTAGSGPDVYGAVATTDDNLSATARRDRFQRR